MPPSTSIASSVEAERKRERVLAVTDGRALVATTPATVRWLLCGRGRPVSVVEPASPYVVVVADERPVVLVPDIESPRVQAEERFEELGFGVLEFPWHEGPAGVLAELGRGVRDAEVEEAIAPLRRELGDEERARYRAAGADAAEAVAACVSAVRSDDSEHEVAARLAFELGRRGFVPSVLLVAGEERQGVYRHPLPTGARLGRHALLAVTAEREGLYTSLTRIVSFGKPPRELERLVRVAAEVDAAMLAVSRPGRPLCDVLAVADRAYAERGFPHEWRLHHQGGLTGYRGREAFATPREEAEIPASCAVAWNPSVSGGGKSEDTALISGDGIEIVTRTPELPELEADGLRRPAIVVL